MKRIFISTLLFMTACVVNEPFPGLGDDETGVGGSLSSGDDLGSMETGDMDEDSGGMGDGDGDGDGDSTKFDVLAIPDAPALPQDPQCTPVVPCDAALAEQANCPMGSHCVGDPGPGHCEPNEDNATCLCDDVYCATGQLCVWLDGGGVGCV